MKKFGWLHLLSIIGGLVLLLAGNLPVIPVRAAESTATGILPGWEHRVKITIDGSKIGSDLTYFPVLIHLGPKSGAAGMDLTGVVNALGNNDKKIAVTEADGVTPLYVEVEKWDPANNEAWLWVSAPNWTISSGIDTTLYLYYDNSHGDNTDYVGETGTGPAQKVWDDQFKAVYHMQNSSPTDNTTILDSTANNYTGTKKGPANPLQAAGDLGSAQQFVSTDNVTGDYIYASSNLGTITGDVTLEAFFNPAGPAVSGNHTLQQSIISTRQFGNDIYLPYALELSTSGTPNMRVGTGDNASIQVEAGISGPLPAPLHTWDYAYGSISGETISCGLDNNSPGTGTFAGTRQPLPTSTAPVLTLGTGDLGTYRAYNGMEDEIRISDVARPRAWLDATYYTLNDNLVSFTPANTLNVKISGEGTGTVKASDETISDTVSSYSGYVYFENNNDQVTLTATPDSGSSFSGWSGDLDSSTGNTATVTMNSDKTVTATFKKNSVSTGGGFFAPPPAPMLYPVATNGFTSTPGLVTNASGIVQNDTELKADRGDAFLKIAKGAKLLDASGKVLTALSASLLVITPDPPPQNAIILDYQFGPEGATFNPPITLTLKYSPQDLPDGASPQDLSLAYRDGSQWNTLESTVDADAGTVSALITHFSQYALMVKLPPPPEFSVSNLSINPGQVNPGEAVTIQASVSNNGGSSGTETVVLKVNGTQEDSQNVTLEAGKEQAITFQLQKEAAGKYTVDVNGVSGEFTVEAPSPTPSPQPTMTSPTTEAQTETPTTAASPSTQATTPASLPESKTSPVFWPIILGVVVVVALIASILVFRARRH